MESALLNGPSLHARSAAHAVPAPAARPGLRPAPVAARAQSSRPGDRFSRFGEAMSEVLAEDLAKIATEFAASVKEAVNSDPSRPSSWADASMREAFKDRLRNEAKSYGAGSWPRRGGAGAAGEDFAVDIIEDAAGYALFADVPGLAKGDLNIKVDARSRQLTISGERRRPAEAEAVDAEGRPLFDGKRQLERPAGRFSRTFILSQKCDLDAITARVEKGVLHLYINKKEAEEPKTVNVPVWD